MPEYSQTEANSTVLPPRVMIGAPQGRSGKTTVSIGLCSAFRQCGLSVMPFKKGPDYIDPSWLSAAANASCRNLDPFLIAEKQLVTSFQEACHGVDLAIIEGAMGLYDGLGPDGHGSSAQVARLLNAPVILVVNTARMTRSIAAMVTGYQHFEPDTNIAGVILNNVSGSRHESKLVSSIEQYCSIPVLGSLPKDPGILITERHLGLIPSREADASAAIINQIQHVVENYLDLDGILSIARTARADRMGDIETHAQKPPVATIGVLFDRVFNFYYPENLEALQRAGAELVFIDSIHDRRLPEVDALYIGGGFPELFMEEMESNASLRYDIAQAAEDGLPVYAECAGLMYLCQSIEWHGQRHEMVGIIPANVEICQRPQGHGYAIAEVVEENPLFPAGSVLRGHEFHYSKLSGLDNLKCAYRMQRGSGLDGKKDGIIYKNVLAAYTHLHAAGVPEWANALVSLAIKARKHQASFATLST